MSDERESALVVTPRLPWPVDDGGKVGLWQAVWSAAQEFSVTLVSLVDAGQPVAALPDALHRLGVELVTVPHRKTANPLAIAEGLWGRWPYPLARFRSRALGRELVRLVAERRPAFVLLNHLHLATQIDALAGTAVVLRAHNLEYLWLERVAAKLSNPAARVYARHQARKMRVAESDLCGRCDLVLAVQEEEAVLLRQLAPAAHVECIPVGLDLERYGTRGPETPPIVLIVGSFNRWANQRGAETFLESAWPQIRARAPQTRLRVVGIGISDAFAAKIRSVGAESVGYVDDIATELARATVLAVPLWVGAGARVKIVEALAARVPVVSTPMAAEGLGLEHGRHLLTAEDGDGLALATLSILENPAQAAALAQASFEQAQARFSLPVVARRTNALCREAVHRRRVRLEARAPVGSST